MSRSLLIGIIATILLFSGIAVFFYLNNIKEKGRLASEAIPNDAFFIFQTKNILFSWQAFVNSPMWSDLQSNPAVSKFNKQAADIADIINHNEDVKEILSEQTTVVSMHNSSNELSLLFAVETGGQIDIEDISAFVVQQTNGKAIKRMVEKIPVYDVTDAVNNQIITIAFYERILLCSYNANLIEDALRKLKYRLPNTTKGFEQVQLLAESNVNANLYINYQRIAKFFSLFTKNEYAAVFNGFKTFANWSMLDLKIDKEQLKLTGVTFTDDSIFQFLDLFKNQTPKELTLQKIMPANTSFAFQMGFTDYMKFNSELNEYLQVRKKNDVYTHYTDSIETRYNIDINERVLPFIDGEAALVMIEPSGSDYDKNLAAFVRFKNPVAMGTALKSFVNAMDKKGEADAVTYFHEGIEIERVKLDNFLKLYYGEIMENIRSPYYSLIEDVYVFANDVNTLKHIISQYKQGSTLVNNEKYKSYSSTLAPNNNVSIFISPSRNFLLPSQFVTDTFFSTLNMYQFDFKKFEFLNIQFANTNNKAFYTHIQYKYNPENTATTQQLWLSKLDTTFDVPPQIIYNTKLKQQVIFVQDVKNTLYCLSNTGALIWRSKLTAKLSGKFYAVDVKNNGSLCYLFSTEKQVNLIDEDGVSLPNYPVNYPGKAIHPIAVNTARGDTALTYFVALENNRIMGYRINGRPIMGWNPKILDSRPVQQIGFFNKGEKQFVYVVNEKGRLLLYDSKGETTDSDDIEYTGTNYFYEETNDTLKVVFNAINNAGHVVQITFDTSFHVIDSAELGSIIPNNKLTTEQDEVTGKTWFIAHHDKGWAFYDPEFKKQAEESNATYAYFTRDFTKRLRLASINQRNKEYRLYDMDGKLLPLISIQGYSSFTTGDVMLDKQNYLIGGDAANNIFMFRLR